MRVQKLLQMLILKLCLDRVGLRMCLYRVVLRMPDENIHSHPRLQNSQNSIMQNLDLENGAPKLGSLAYSSISIMYYLEKENLVDFSNVERNYIVKSLF